MPYLVEGLLLGGGLGVATYYSDISWAAGNPLLSTIWGALFGGAWFVVMKRRGEDGDV